MTGKAIVLKRNAAAPGQEFSCLFPGDTVSPDSSLAPPEELWPPRSPPDVSLPRVSTACLSPVKQAFPGPGCHLLLAGQQKP